jgi:two-component system response regulator AtoC
MEHDVILKVLQANHWNRRKAAEILKISYRALLYKVRQAGIPAKRPQRKIADVENLGAEQIDESSPLD